MRSIISLAAFFAVAGALALYLGDLGARELEAETGNRASAALAADGWGTLRAEAEGLRLHLTGEAASDEARAAALDTVADAAPWAWVRHDIRLRQPIAAPPPPPRVEILRGLNDVTLSGRAPDAATQSALREAVKAAAPGISLTDLTIDGASAEDDGWAQAAANAAEVAGDLIHGRIELSTGVVTVSGLARDEAALVRLGARLDGLKDAGWRVDSAVFAPPPSAKAFELRARMTGDGGALTQCAARDETEAAAILAEASALFVSAPRTCRIGAGAPDENWRAAASASMRAVAALPAGEISLVGRRARLTAEPPTRLRALTEARAALAENLPRNYRLAVIAAAPEGGVAGDDPSPAMSGAAETVLTFDGEEMVFSGAAPSEVLAEALVAFARARLRDVAVRNALTPAPDLAAGDWRAAAATLLSGLTRLTRGEARLTAGAARLEGETPEAREIPALHRFIRGGIGDGREVVTRIRVALAAKAAATPTPPGRCAARLNRIVEASPIRFEPNSTQINEASAPIVTRLAAALSDCAGGVIEIGGHTDSQGSARLNLGLSRSRAFAVLDALLATDVDPRLLTARGYGEEQPIADNGTEAGRARNRRIAFSVTRAQAADGGDGGDEQR